MKVKTGLELATNLLHKIVNGEANDVDADNCLKDLEQISRGS